MTGKVRLVIGYAFEALERDAADLCALGFARRVRAAVVVPPVATKPAVVAKVVTPQADSAGEEQPKAAGRGRYARRDLRAAS